jgi:hypothetical protein
LLIEEEAVMLIVVVVVVVVAVFVIGATEMLSLFCFSFSVSVPNNIYVHSVGILRIAHFLYST